MIRTAFSFLALFGSLLLVSKALTQSQTNVRPQPCCSGEASETCESPQQPAVELQHETETTLRSIEQHQLTAVSLPGGLVLLPAENEPTAPARDASRISDGSVQPVALQELTDPRASTRRPTTRPERVRIHGAKPATKVHARNEDDRPIGSGLRDPQLEEPLTDDVESDKEPAAEDTTVDDVATDELGEDAERMEDDTTDSLETGSLDNELNDESLDGETGDEPSEDDATIEETDSDAEAEESEAEQSEAEQSETKKSAKKAPGVRAVIGDEPGLLDTNGKPQARTDQGSPELDPQMLRLRNKVRNVLAWHIERPEAVEQRSPWGIMHALIAYGVDTEVTQGDRRVNAIGWMCFNGPCRGQQLLYSEDGRLRTRQGPGVQGHEGQFLAMLAQSKVKLDFPIRIDSNEYTVADLVDHEKLTCVEKTELTFKLIGLSHYLDTDAKWKNAAGQEWDLPKLIKEELAQPVIGAACGGTHRMMGFSYAIKKREKQGRPITGQWLRAKKYVDAYHDYTFKLQNDNGSFSTSWFQQPGEYGTPDRYLETTGHILEWMVYSLSDEQLRDPRTIKAVNFLATLMWDNREHDWEIGPKGHALHALAMYDERVFQGKPGQRRVQLAEHRRAAAAR